MSLIKSFGGFVKSARYLISLANKYYVDTESDEELEYIKKLEEVITENPMIVVSKYGNFLCVHNDQIEDTSFYNIESDEYSFVDLDNPKPFLSFKMKSFDDIINGTEKLVNSGN